MPLRHSLPDTQIAPLNTGKADPVAAASLPADADAAMAAQHAARFPQIDTSKHVVMEVKEPDFFPERPEEHEKHELLRVRQAQVQAEFDAKKKAADASRLGVATVDTSSTNTTQPPLSQPITDPQALAEAMAASAGEGASKSPADYLTEATTLAASLRPTWHCGPYWHPLRVSCI